MVKFTLEGNTYEIPQEFTIEQWQRIICWDFEDSRNWPRILSVASGAPQKVLGLATYDSQQLGIVFIATVLSQRKETKIRDFNTLTFGEWVDLDVYFNLGVDKHIYDILKILYPKNNVCKSVAEAQWIIEKFSEWRTYIYKQYAKLFGLDGQSESDESEKPEPMAIARGWYRIIVDLANNDVLKIDEVTEKPLKQILNFMALQKEKALEEQQRILKQQRQYDLQRNSR